jgi:ribosomal protein S11
MVAVTRLGDGPRRFLRDGGAHLRHRRPEPGLRGQALHGELGHAGGLLLVEPAVPEPAVDEPRHPALPDPRQDPRRQVLGLGRRRQAGDGLEQQYAEAVHVGLGGHDARAEEEGVGVARRSHGGARRRHGRREALAGGAQVAEPRAAVEEEHVGRRHVAVHHGGGGAAAAAAVQVLQRARHVVEGAHALRPRQRGGRRAVERVRQRAAGEVLQHQRAFFLCMHAVTIISLPLYSTRHG